LKPRVEVWHDDRCTFSEEYRSEAAARRMLISRIEECLQTGATVTLTKDGVWWVFTCTSEGLSYRVRFRPAFTS
jgi:hypothetical protein